MVSNSGLHCGRNAQRLVDAPEVVIHEVQRYGMIKVLDLLAKVIGQTGEAAHSHTRHTFRQLSVVQLKMPRVKLVKNKVPGLLQANIDFRGD